MGTAWDIFKPGNYGELDYPLRRGLPDPCYEISPEVIKRDIVHYGETPVVDAS